MIRQLENWFTQVHLRSSFIYEFNSIISLKAEKARINEEGRKIQKESETQKDKEK